jgi:ferrous iron transport protein A
MYENIFVLLIISLAVIFIIKKFNNAISRNKTGCGCDHDQDCAGCSGLAPKPGDQKNPLEGQLLMKKIVNMREMADNQTGVIKKIKSGGELSRRIREMGVVPGAEIMIMGRAPLKDPVAIKIKDFILTLRNNEADYILVEIDSPCEI